MSLFPLHVTSLCQKNSIYPITDEKKNTFSRLKSSLRAHRHVGEMTPWSHGSMFVEHLLSASSFASLSAAFLSSKFSIFLSSSTNSGFVGGAACTAANAATNTHRMNNFMSATNTPVNVRIGS